MIRRPHTSSGFAFSTVVLMSTACADGATASETDQPCESAPSPQSLPELDAGFALTEDVDGDGHVDIVMSPFHGDEAPLTIRWGSADGELGAAQELPFTSLGDMRTGSLILSDLDGDGDLEVLRVSWDIEVAEAQARIEVAMQTAPRSFDLPVSSEPEGLGPARVIGVDLDADGDDELAGVGSGLETSIFTIPNDGPSFDALVPGIATSWIYARQLVAVDLDGDGGEELVAYGRPPDGDTTTPTLLVASADANLALVQVGEYAAGADPGSVDGNFSLGDFDDDGHLDLCVVNFRDLSMFRGLEGVGFSDSQILAFPEFAESSECESCNLILDTRAGDFDGDGVDELGVNLVMGGSWIIDETLAETPTLVSLEQRGNNVADFDGDDCDDLLAVDVTSNGPLGTIAEWTLIGCPLGSCE